MSHSRLSGFFLLLVSVGLISLSGQTDDRLGGDAAWTRLTEANESFRRSGTLQSRGFDWTTLATEARTFRNDYPNHPQARAAGGIELTARVKIEENKGVFSDETAAAVTDYVNDTGNAVRDRLGVKINFDQAKLHRVSHSSREARLQAHVVHALELIQGFPDQPDGYGYLLSLARLAPLDDARRLAEQLLTNKNTPVLFEGPARRMVERPGLLGKPLRLAGAEAEIAHAEGKTLVVYSWRKQDEGFLDIVKKMTAQPGVEFIGINLDPGNAAARSVARDLPGPQFFDGGGLDGPLATQLKLVIPATVYLVDAQGVLREMDIQGDPYAGLVRFVARNGGGK